MKKGTSNTLWILAIAVLGIFILVMMIYMTQGKTQSFSEFFSDNFNRVSSGLLGFGDSGGEGTFTEDKEILNWMAERANSTCENGGGPFSEQYIFSNDLMFLKTQEINGEYYMIGKWDRPREDERIQKGLQNCKKEVDMRVEGTGNIRGDENYEITIKTGDEQKTAIIELKQIESEKEKNKRPEAVIKKLSSKGYEVEFTASKSKDSDGNIEEYQWDFNYNENEEFVADQKHSKNYEAEHVYSPEVHNYGSTPKKFLAALRVKDNMGKLSEITTTEVTIRFEGPTPKFNCNIKDKGSLDKSKIGDTLVCEDAGSVPNTGSISKYRWKLYHEGDKVMDKEGEEIKEFDYKIKSLGSYEVEFGVSNEEKSASDTIQFDVENDPPEPDFTYEFIEYEGKEEGWNVSFDASPTTDPEGDEITSYVWEIGNKETIEKKIFTTTLKPGNTEITLKASDGNKKNEKTKEMGWYNFPGIKITNVNYIAQSDPNTYNFAFKNIHPDSLNSPRGILRDAGGDITALNCKNGEKENYVSFINLKPQKSTSLRLGESCNKKSDQNLYFNITFLYKLYDDQGTIDPNSGEEKWKFGYCVEVTKLKKGFFKTTVEWEANYGHCDPEDIGG